MKAIHTAFLIVFLLPGLLSAAPDVPVAEQVDGMQEVAAAEQNKLTMITEKFGVTLPTLIAQMVNFCLVAAVLYFFAVKPIAKTLDERQQKIADGLQYAEEMKTQLAEAERERAEKIKEAAQEAQRILSEAREQSKEMIEHKTQEAAAQAESIIRKASEATELERQKMLSDVRQEVARLVVVTASKVLEKELSDSDKQTYSETAAKELAETAS
ncbi:MAG: F0F1 ATP synthase subunit B [Opitutales bacterium]